MNLDWVWNHINTIGATVGGVAATATATYGLYRFWRSKYYKDEYFKIVKHSSNSPKPKLILVIGLEGSGKSCFLTSFGETRPIKRAQPTAEMTRRTVIIENTEFTLYEVKAKSYWSQLLNILKIKSVVFVVDSSDHSSMPNAKQELAKFSSEIDTKDVQLLVAANKQDVPGALTPQQVLQSVRDDKFTYNDIQVVGTTVGVGKGRSGVFDAFQYLSQ